MKIGLFAKTFAGTDPRVVLNQCRAAGFQAVQYNMACSGIGSLPEEISPNAAAAVTAAAISNGIEIAAVSATYNMAHPDLAKREAGRRSFQAIAACAKSMGTNLVTVCSGSRDPDDQWRWHPDNDSSESWSQMCREFEALLSIADAQDVLIGVEPEHANIVRSTKAAKRLLDSFSGSRVRIIVDPANLLEGCPKDQLRAVLADTLDLLGPHIALAHVKDRDEAGKVAAAGRGIVDWDHYLGGLKQIGYRGALIAHGMDASDAPYVSDFLRAKLGGF
jgi:sugar phosphate isomerase/epimerase